MSYFGTFVSMPLKKNYLASPYGMQIHALHTPRRAYAVDVRKRTNGLFFHECSETPQNCCRLQTLKQYSIISWYFNASEAVFELRKH